MIKNHADSHQLHNLRIYWYYVYVDWLDILIPLAKFIFVTFVNLFYALSDIV